MIPNTKNVLLALIVLLAALFPAIYGISQDYLLAVIALGLGIIWLLLEIRDQPILPSIFFVCFVGLAGWGTLRGLPNPVMLVAVCIDLAAWDLSRFRARIANSGDHAANLETAHLQKLAVTIGAGFVVALLPTLIRLPIHLSFVVFFGVVLLVVLILRKSVFSLRS